MPYDAGWFFGLRKFCWSVGEILYISWISGCWGFFFFFSGCAVRLAGSQFPAQGQNTDPLQWRCRVLTAGPPGNSHLFSLKTNKQNRRSTSQSIAFIGLCFVFIHWILTECLLSAWHSSRGLGYNREQSKQKFQPLGAYFPLFHGRAKGEKDMPKG